MEDVIGVIKGLEAENTGRLKIMRYVPLSDLEQQNHEFHLRWNLEIIERLKRFL